MKWKKLLYAMERKNNIGHHKHPHKRDFLIKLILEEIKYDVKFDSWQKSKVFNRNLKNQNKDAEKVGIAYNNDDANDWLVRQIDTAINNIYGELAWCTREYDRYETNQIEEQTPTEWSIHLEFPCSWAGSMRAMKSHAHKYVVSYVLAQWYRAGDVGSAESYIADADNALTRLYQEARSEKVSLPPWQL